MLYVLLVGRSTEFLPVLARIRPVALASLVALLLFSNRTPPATWRAATRHPQFVRMLLYLALATITVPFAIWPGGSVGVILPMTYGTILLLAFLLAPPDARSFERVIAAILLGTAFSSIATILGGAVSEGTRLATGGSYDPNDLAAFDNVLLFLALGRAMRGKFLHRIVFVALALLFVVVSLKTASRGGAIALGVGALVFLAGLGGRQLFIGVLVTALAVPIGWQVAPPTFRERIATLTTIDQDYNATSTSGRSYIWHRGLVFFVHRPIIGVGAGNFDTELGRDFAAQGEVGAWHTAHNTVLQVFVELGLFGGVLYLTMIGFVIRETGRFWRPTWRGRATALAKVGLHRPELLAAAIAYCTAALFLSHAYNYLTFGIIALGTYASRVRRDVLGMA